MLLSSNRMDKAWWKSAVVYQIYPSSFLDTNGDGLGDLRGVIRKLDYIRDLGANVIWLSPIFKSPQVDMGYDISDYKDIHAPYGTVADVDKLIAELHKRDMKLVLDLVVNHTSDEHPWFLESRSSKSSPKRDWFFWKPPTYDEHGERQPPSNWKDMFGGGSQWEWDEKTQEYYLHSFAVEQPDLNFDTPAVRDAVWDLMRFWLDKGCDGYRMDVIGRISKDPAFADAPIIDPESKYQHAPRKDGPHLHEYIQEMHEKVLCHYDVMTVGELGNTTVEGMLKFVHPDRNELQMGFSFDHVNIGLMPSNRYIVDKWTLPEFKAIMADWQHLRDLGGWHALYLENHDQPRSVSRYLDDSPKWRWAGAKLLALMHTTMFGTVYLYQGQEIGMINIPNDWPLEEWKDVQTQNVVKEVRRRGHHVEEMTKRVYFKARDNSRTPMQWSDTIYAGFSEAAPWMRVPDDYKICNVEQQENDPLSVLSFWKQCLQMRREHENALVYGSFRLLAPDDNAIFAYTRDDRYLVVLNCSAQTVQYGLPKEFAEGKIVKTTSKEGVSIQTGSMQLEPYEGSVMQRSIACGQDR